MAAAPYVPTYHSVSVTPSGLGTFNVNYIEAGSSSLPKLVLLHGFPSSTTQFREFIPLLAGSYHVLAPDLPGFGLTTYPSDFKFNFENLTEVVGAWLVALDVKSYVPYIFDYGAPILLRLALQNPNPIKAIITQNGNAYDAGFGADFWAPIFALWENGNSTKDRDVLRDNVLTLATTKFQYVAGVPEADHPLIDPVTWHSDYLSNIAGKENQEHQLDLFYDYRTNKAMYPAFHEYFRKSQVPLLAIWGKHDPAFIFPGAEAYKQDLPNAEVVLLDAGHFALETKRWEVAKYVLDFLKRIGY